MRRNRRRVHVPPDLTSLFDVLFIVIFAALIRAAATQQAAAQLKELFETDSINLLHPGAGVPTR